MSKISKSTTRKFANMTTDTQTVIQKKWRLHDAEVGYHVPTNQNPVLLCYVKGAGRKFRLTLIMA